MSGTEIFWAGKSSNKYYMCNKVLLKRALLLLLNPQSITLRMNMSWRPMKANEGHNNVTLLPHCIWRSLIIAPPSPTDNTISQNTTSLLSRMQVPSDNGNLLNKSCSITSSLTKSFNKKVTTRCLRPKVAKVKGYILETKPFWPLFSKAKMRLRTILFFFWNLCK